MLVIHPDECIDCGVCEPECPVDAIQADTDDGADEWLVLNREMSEIWPNIIEKKDPPEDADDFVDVKDKFKQFFKKWRNAFLTRFFLIFVLEIRFVL